MKLKIHRIEDDVVTCIIEDTHSLIDIGRQWLSTDIKEGDEIEIDVTKNGK